MFDDATAYSALTSRDPRFDGVFFVGVTSTGVYCRPVCPARTPRQENCRFFETAAAAEKSSFRPCLRCRPELAPGNAPVDDAQRVAHLLARRIEEGLVESGAGLEEIASQFGLSSRQLRRIVQQELGVSPIELLQTRRLLLAKQLLTETGLPITQIAFASGFASLRRFNDAFSSRYRMPPGRLRKQAAGNAAAFDVAGTSTLQLNYRPPYDWRGMLQFLGARTMAGVEWITADSYARTVRLGAHTGWILVTQMPERHALSVQFSHSLAPVLPAMLGRLRNLFDLSARPDQIAAHLLQDRSLRKEIELNPGLRVPGAFDGFELATRAILGQQITVKAATTLACRFAAQFGEAIVTPHPELNRLSPQLDVVARGSVAEVAELGIVGSRASSIVALAQALQAGELQLEAGAPAEQVVRKLTELPGIGPWTAQYIAMRALRWPDAFPKGDVAILNNLGGITAKQAEAMSEAWRPWRSYAVFHIWRRQRSV
jgi:AraC family transcriptional regulator of adaptative response / DNA-3-methyladenine glycosylase II